mmetsp:Transcript_49728/g.118364  ORF Transcript_49728/g.118364 Transcript_49728/m.118364 type:complete len:318 (-) Transcript_49728:396-1349(-)
MSDRAVEHRQVFLDRSAENHLLDLGYLLLVQHTAEKLLLGIVEPLRKVDIESHHQVTIRPRMQDGHAFVADRLGEAWLRDRVVLDLDGAVVDGRDVEREAEQRLKERNVRAVYQVMNLSCEAGVVVDSEAHVDRPVLQPRRLVAFLEEDSGPRVWRARGDVHAPRHRLEHHLVPPADRAGGVDELALPLALGTRRVHTLPELPERLPVPIGYRAPKPRPVAVRAREDVVLVRGAAPVAMRAYLLSRERDVELRTEVQIQQLHIHRHHHVRSLIRRILLRRLVLESEVSPAELQEHVDWLVRRFTLLRLFSWTPAPRA